MLAQGRKRKKQSRQDASDDHDDTVPTKRARKDQPRFRMVRDQAGPPDHRHESSGERRPVAAVEVPREIRQPVARSVEPGTLQAMSLAFIQSDTPVLDAIKLLADYSDFIKSGVDEKARGANYIKFFIDNEMFRIYRRFVGLQTAVMGILRQAPLSIPVEGISTEGIVRRNAAWEQLRTRNESLYKTVIAELEYLVIVIDEFFRSFAHFLFDPVSTCFFIAVHILGKPRLDKTPVLYHALKSFAMVSPSPLPRVIRPPAHPAGWCAQDLHRIFTVIKGLSDFLHAHCATDTLPSDIRDMLTPALDEPLQNLLERELPHYIKEFLVEPQHCNKSMRVTRFENLVSAALPLLNGGRG